MERRDLFKGALAASLLGAPQLLAQTPSAADVVIERAVSGAPHRGKVLALITPHLDDGPFFANGTVTKLLQEGYTGYFIRTSNDEKDSYDLSLGETVLGNERDAKAFLQVSGLKQMFELGYRNHRMDDLARTEIRARLIFLFRLLKIDTVFSYDPWGHYEENPDHYVTAQAVEAACWMSADHLDFPEQFDAGVTVHGVSEKYYFARGPQLVNRVVDIGPMVKQKAAYIASCSNMITNMVQSTNDSLKSRGLRVPSFAGPQETANEAYIQAAFLERDRRIGAKYGLEYAEEFHYIGPDRSLDDYIRANALKIGL